MPSGEFWKRQLPIFMGLRHRNLRSLSPVWIWVIVLNALNAVESWKMRVVVRSVRAAVFPSADEIFPKGEYL
jgi:hypothetical protein